MRNMRDVKTREVEELWQRVQSLGWSRRKFLALLGSGGVAAVLSACGGGSPSPSPQTRTADCQSTPPQTSAESYKQQGAAQSQTGNVTDNSCYPSTEEPEVYDYVIVGSGAGGGPLAANLARKGHTVLLLEAGGIDEPLSYSVPVLHGNATEDRALSWQYFVRHYSDWNPGQLSEDKKVHMEDGSYRIFYPRAGTLGGCTAHYAMITVYPHNSDWDYIAEITGDESWRPTPMRRYFKRVERYFYVDPRAAEEPDDSLWQWWTWLQKSRWSDLGYWNSLRNVWADAVLYPLERSAGHLARHVWVPGRHGFQGWLPINVAPLALALQDKQILDIALSAIGTAAAYNLKPITWGLDPNHWVVAVERREGLLRVPMATDGKNRRGVREYLTETQKKHWKCLTIETNALVTKVLFEEGKPLLAKGVEYYRGAHLYAADPGHNTNRPEGKKCCAVRARKEVILSAGAFNTPQLLMLSGIGPKRALESKGVECKLDLPGVGQNLQDRYEVGVITELENNFTALEEATFSDSASDLLFSEWKQGKGLYTTNGAILGIIKRSRPERPDPDLFIFGVPGHFNGYYPGWSREATAPKNQFTWLILKAHTNNTAGTVTLRSNDPCHTPEINFHYFEEGSDSTGEDLDSVLEGIKFVRQINKHVARRVPIKREILPGEHIKEDNALRNFIRTHAWGHHACGTCKMGPKTDPLAVVDSKFLVHGTKNLRIVDASIFPKIPGFFIVMPIYMISEKANDVLHEAA